jgi:HNH endonuclease
MARRPARELLESLDRDALAKFQAGIRKRYSDEDIVGQLQASAERLGRSPSMREFAADPETSVHPQTVIEHFGTWNAAKRAAGLVPRRFATREELLQLLRELGERLERTPTARDLDEHRGSMPSKSLYWHTFGSLTNALREAGFDVPVGEERLERAIDQGCRVALELGRLPKFQEWGAARREDDSLLTEWQIYRMFDVSRGAWSTFQYLVAEGLRADGYQVAPDGRVSRKRSARAKRAPSGGAGRTRARQARARRGGRAR